jgi:formiminoglutamate deiminase
MTAFWCELAWLGGAGAEAGVLIECDGERIATVRTAVAAAPAGAQRLNGLVLPGLANAHSHAFQRALRGRTHGGEGTFWTWREQMYALADGLDEAAVEALARATFAEMALAGITLVGEFDYLHHSEAVIRAAQDAGIRLTLIDACYLHGGLPRFRDASVEAWAERVGRRSAPPGVRLGAAIHSIRAVDPESARVVAAVAAEHGWPLHAHVSEQPAENQDCQQRYGDSPTAVLARAGVLEALFTAVHATHLLEHDRALLESSGAFCCMCPTTERDLADGIGTPPGRLALGSDSNAVIDLFEEARAVELNERLLTGVRGKHTVAELATAATANGYASLGWPEGGRIEPGALADLVTVSLDGPRLAGTRPAEALDAAVFAATREDVSSVIVGGRPLNLDPERVAAQLREAIPQ